MILGRYIQYLRYLVVHKYYVLIECWKRGLILQGITHDLSKFRPSEFFPYANFFYGKPFPSDNWHGDIRNHIRYQSTEAGYKEAFDYAWLLHQKRNPHHWQYWLLQKDDGDLIQIRIPQKYLLEMLCDWIGAGKAQGYHSPKNDPYKEVTAWYQKNQHNIRLSLQNRCAIENIIYYQNLKK